MGGRGLATAGSLRLVAVALGDPGAWRWETLRAGEVLATGGIGERGAGEGGLRRVPLSSPRLGEEAACGVSSASRSTWKLQLPLAFASGLAGAGGRVSRPRLLRDLLRALLLCLPSLVLLRGRTSAAASAAGAGSLRSGERPRALLFRPSRFALLRGRLCAAGLQAPARPRRSPSPLPPGVGGASRPCFSASRSCASNFFVSFLTHWRLVCLSSLTSASSGLLV